MTNDWYAAQIILCYDALRKIQKLSGVFGMRNLIRESEKRDYLDGNFKSPNSFDSNSVILHI